jgi:hypothetical protein
LRRGAGHARGAGPVVVRAPFVRAYEGRQQLRLLGDDGRWFSFDGDSAGLVATMLDELREPRGENELLQRVAELGGAKEPTAAVREALLVLKTAGAVRTAPPRSTRRKEREPRRVVVALAGGVAAAHAPALAEHLHARECQVRFAATPSALRFVSRLALEAITHERVVGSMWPEAGDPTSAAVPHLALARWAELVVVYPATATTVSRIARGDCSSIVSALAISARVPVMIVPAMNAAMLEAPAVQRNLGQLKEDGFFVVHPAVGYEVADAPNARARSRSQGGFTAPLPVDRLADLVSAALREV